MNKVDEDRKKWSKTINALNISPHLLCVNLPCRIVIHLPTAASQTLSCSIIVLSPQTQQSKNRAPP